MARPTLGRSTGAMILHVDMDAFYASVEQRDRPELRGKPVVVGGSAEGRGVVAAASYEARAFGIHSAMPTRTAKRHCPHAIFLPVRMQHYASISDHVQEIFGRFTPLVEPLSLDEAFLDVTGSQKLFGTASEIGRRIKHDILDALQLVASVGVAPNKFLAKIASDLEKPNGFVVVDPRNVQTFLDPLPVGRLWGVGRVAGEAFQRLGIRTIAHLRNLTAQTLHDQFGEQGDHLWRLARGMDDRQVVPDRRAKSISHETTFDVDTEDREVLTAWLLELTDQVARRLRRHNLQGRTVHLKVRFRDFHTITRSLTLVNPTNVTQEIYQAARQLFDQRTPANHPAVRLIGVGLSGFDRDAQRQRLLFGEQAHEQQQQIDETSDQIRRRFGKASLSRASRLLHQTHHRPPPSVWDKQTQD